MATSMIRRSLLLAAIAASLSAQVVKNFVPVTQDMLLHP